MQRWKVSSMTLCINLINNATQRFWIIQTTLTFGVKITLQFFKCYFHTHWYLLLGGFNYPESSKSSRQGQKEPNRNFDNFNSIIINRQLNIWRVYVWIQFDDRQRMNMCNNIFDAKLRGLTVPPFMCKGVLHVIVNSPPCLTNPRVKVMLNSRSRNAIHLST